MFTPTKELREKVESLAYGMGISFYIREDGTVHQNGPGVEVRTTPKAKPVPHGIVDSPVGTVTTC